MHAGRAGRPAVRRGQPVRRVPVVAHGQVRGGDVGRGRLPDVGVVHGQVADRGAVDRRRRRRARGRGAGRVLAGAVPGADDEPGDAEDHGHGGGDEPGGHPGAPARPAAGRRRGGAGGAAAHGAPVSGLRWTWRRASATLSTVDRRRRPVAASASAARPATSPMPPTTYAPVTEPLLGAVVARRGGRRRRGGGGVGARRAGRGQLQRRRRVLRLRGAAGRRHVDPGHDLAVAVGLDRLERHRVGLRQRPDGQVEVLVLAGLDAARGRLPVDHRDVVGDLVAVVVRDRRATAWPG